MKAQTPHGMTSKDLEEACAASGLVVEFATSRTVLAAAQDPAAESVTRRAVALLDPDGPGWMCAYGVEEPRPGGSRDLIMWSQTYHTSLEDFGGWLAGWQSVPVADSARRRSAA